MALENLTVLEILEGTTSLIYAITGTIVGLIIAAKYFKRKAPELLGIGISLLLATAPWYGAGISFLTFIFFGFILPDPLYFFINYGLLALVLIFWMNAMSILLFENTQRITLITAIICALYEIVFIIILVTNISMIGTKEGKFNSDATLFSTIFVLIVLVVILITMIIFIRESLQSKNMKIKWKGRFLLIATILLVVGSFMDASVTITPITLMVARIILILRLIFSYLGWLLPDRVANWLIEAR
ncbi:MAG: conserved membrane protein of unknown function [Promethearchaeota archaeon]|nr:MAG: conserved membrane protein of unknown function [Candidatus Lokiarchaeota archaeon]